MFMLKNFPYPIILKYFIMQSLYLNRSLIIKSEFPYKAIVGFNQIGSSHKLNGNQKQTKIKKQNSVVPPVQRGKEKMSGEFFTAESKRAHTHTHTHSRQ